MESTIEINNRYATGTSYACIDEGETTLDFTKLEDAVQYFTDTLKGFYSERTGEYSRWNYCSKNDLSWNVHTQTLDYETNLETIKTYLDENGVYECSGGTPPKYEIKISKEFKVTVKTFIHITLQSQTLSWFSKDAIKSAIIKKRNYIVESI